MIFIIKPCHSFDKFSQYSDTEIAVTQLATLNMSVFVVVMLDNDLDDARHKCMKFSLHACLTLEHIHYYSILIAN
jgi:hypothetical protein